jgi:vitamin B12 transporter
MLILLPLLLGAAASARGDGGGDIATIGLFAGEEELIVSAARSPRPVSQIAENVTVITAQQIALLNAHTLAEVLNTVPGIQLDKVQTPGSFTFFNIQGAPNTHVLLLIDGVPQNDLLQSQADVGLIPVQHIERVEIIKGAASAAWGQALGGVVNVITKSPDSDRPAGGMVSASTGERFTADTRGELTGTVGRFGYYLSAGNLHSDGLLPNNAVNRNNAYAKFVYDLPVKGTITLGGDFADAFRGTDEAFAPSWGITTHDTQALSHSYAFLNVTYPFSDRLTLEVLIRHSRKDDEAVWGEIKNGLVILDNDFHLRESTRGGSAKLTWGDSRASLVTGLEYEHAETRQRDALVPDSPLLTDRTADRWGAFANGALTVGHLTVLPGVRFDHTGVGSDYFSYTVGATYRLTEKTVLRGYGAQGYSLPNAIFGHGPQRVWTVQTGAETGEIPFVWLKGTLFYNNLDNVEDLGTGTLHDQVKQGFEVEARSVPVYGFTLAGGYTYLDARDSETRERLQSGPAGGFPPHSGKISLTYDNARLGLSGILTGNYVWWHAAVDANARDKAIIWDLSLTQKILPARELSPELFFSAHNLFNGAQTLDNTLFRNAPRWLEGGVRFKF